MRIGIVTDTYTPQVNGVTTVVRRVADMVAAQGHEVALAAPRYPGAHAVGKGELRVPSVPFPPYPAIRLSWPRPGELARFFDELPAPIDHVLVTGPGPYYAPLAEFDFEKARRDIEAHLLLPLQVARNAAKKVRPGGTLLFMSGTGGRSTSASALIAALTAGIPALAKALARDLAPVRLNVIAAGFVDTPLSASLLGDQLDARRERLRKTLPIRRVVGPADIAALAIHLMTNTAVTGATYDIDGGQQLVEG